MKLKKKWLVIFPIIIAVVVFLVVYSLFNNVDKNNFTVQETNWIKEYKNSIIDISALSDYPVYGDGVFKNFIDDFTIDTGITFNYSTILKESKDGSNAEYSFRALAPGEKVDKNDLFLQDDVYILYGAEKGIIDDFGEL